ncbi:MAG: hypothetical protein F4073_00555 [Rhodobacteraceae bacterium]|nr:hypothetical protein [Paracoccaceae bacterium]MDE2759264.1 hypothetical protein [Paracoccaceae bacterium]MDE2916562.1 hypothetical protein [Paracoccaceae bacterium]MYF47250.1 hypothetical protein [Paracoccaceae bacterium]MYI90426.1 hypothetical protein [Paracoccaceae bacterium]
MSWPAFFIWLCLTLLLGFGTNIVNQQTNEVRREVERLTEVKELNSEKLQILEVQWVHLTNPEFIRELTEENFDRLWMVPGTNLDYGSIEDLPYYKESQKDENQ